MQKQIAKLNALFESKGFGFLHQNDNGTFRSFFFHLSNLVSGVPEVGCEALFIPGTNPKGVVALEVEVLPKGKKASDVLAEKARAAGMAALSSSANEVRR